MGRDKHEKRRRHKGPPFVQLFNYVIDSDAYRRLSLAARAALVEMVRLYNGMNNGQLAMPARTLADRLGASKTMAARALNELENAGFIETTKVGSFRRKDRLASEYRLTFHRCDESHTPPSKAFMRRDTRLHGIKIDNNGPVGGTVAA